MGGSSGLGGAPPSSLSRPLKSSGGGDIKDELRRAGLLTLPQGDSYSASSSVDTGGAAAAAGGGRAAAAAAPPPSSLAPRPVYDAEFSISNSNIEDVLGGGVAGGGGGFGENVSVLDDKEAFIRRIA